MTPEKSATLNSMLTQKGLAPIVIIILIAAAIGGFLVYSGKINLKQETTTQIAQPTPTPDDSPVPNGTGETVGWKTYNDEKNGYSIRYPKEWNLKSPSGQEDPTDLVLKNGLETINIIVFPTDKKTLAEWQEFTKDKEGSSTKIIEQSSVTIDSIEAEKVVQESFQRSGQVTVTTVNNEKVYQIITIFSSTTKEMALKDFDQILSTFKFQ